MASMTDKEIAKAAREAKSSGADVWHRVAAARQVGATSIDALVHEGGRQEALKHALHANTQHGLRRTNADKRRCVEIAIAEFGNLSSRVIAEMCGVGHSLVLTVKTSGGRKGHLDKNRLRRQA